MNGYRRTFLLLPLLLATLPLLAETGKNLLQIRYRSLPERAEKLLTEDPGSWDFNFRPYGKSTRSVPTDPILLRSVGTKGDGPRKETAVSVSCDERGFTLLVFCADPGIDASLAATNDIPTPPIEFLFAPGDAETAPLGNYYQLYYEDGKLTEFPWLEQTRDFRPIRPYTTVEERIVEGGFLFRFAFAWDPFFDRLPLDSKSNDNFWRLSVIRWGEGGETWGGTIHQTSQAGYIRWPDFTKEQKTTIREHVLRRAWTSFRGLSSQPAYTSAGGWGGIPICRAPYRLDELKTTPRSYVNYGEDPEFRPVLERLTAERNGLGPEIARFRELPEKEQRAFYEKASDMLFNFAYDVQEAYAAQETSRLFPPE